MPCHIDCVKRPWLSLSTYFVTNKFMHGYKESSTHTVSYGTVKQT